MGNFEKSIPKNIKQLETEINALYRESRGLDWGHDCDCEYCTEQSGIPPETEERDNEITAEIDQRKVMIRRLKRHAVANGVELV